MKNTLGNSKDKMCKQGTDFSTDFSILSFCTVQAGQTPALLVIGYQANINSK